MDKIDRRLLTEVQRRFPLESRPYKTLAERLSLKEEEILERLERLKEAGVLRQISAIFDPKALGYETCLVAAEVPKKILDEAVRVINAYPGVSHNYLRDHRLNIWFTIAVPPGERLEDTVAALLARAGVEKYLLLPIKRVFHIAVVHDLDRENGIDSPSEAQAPPSGEKKFSLPDERTVSLVRLTQEDLPRVKHPFRLLAERVDLGEEELLLWLKKGLETGLIRRFAGLVKHTRAGLKGNIMVAWEVPEERLEEVGNFFAREKKITHCYERQSYPEWPYNLYTMIHAKDEKEARETVYSLASQAKVEKFLPLTTLRELKKIRLKLFW